MPNEEPLPRVEEGSRFYIDSDFSFVSFVSFVVQEV